MKEKDYLVIAVILVAMVLVILYLSNFGDQQASVPSAFRFGNRTYKITAYAATAKAQEKGLMNATVTNSTFMLFYFGKPHIYPFWMKNTYSPLDIIWLNYSNSTGIARVVYIVNATPCIDYDATQNNCTIYAPKAYANYVLEARAGLPTKLGWWWVPRSNYCTECRNQTMYSRALGINSIQESDLFG